MQRVRSPRRRHGVGVIVKVLYVSPWTPVPRAFGAALRVDAELKMLKMIGADVTFLSFRSWTDHDIDAEMNELVDRHVLVDLSPNHGLKAKARSVGGIHSVEYERHRSKAMQEQLDGFADERWDTVIVSSTAMAVGYRLPPSRHVLDLHNVEGDLMRERVKSEKNLVRRGALWVDGIKYRREELAALNRYDLALAPSNLEREAVTAMCRTEAALLPNCIDLTLYPPTKELGNRALFVGATHVHANRDGLEWLATDIWPRIAPLPLDVVGGNPPDSIRTLEHLGGVIHGYVPDTTPFWEAAGVFVVPLRIGAGTRLKVLEAMARGVPVVSTWTGIEGLDVKSGEHAMVADVGWQFADLVRQVLHEPELAAKLRANGMELAARYDYTAWAWRLNELLNR